MVTSDWPRLEESKKKKLIREFVFSFYVKHDHLKCRLNVKEVWILFMMREKAKNFFVTEFHTGVLILLAIGVRFVNHKIRAIRARMNEKAQGHQECNA